MKTTYPFPSLHSHWATILLVATAALTLTINSRAAQSGSLEVLVTGDLASEPDHTGADDGSYDVCRNTSFSGGGADQLVLRKLRLDLTSISAAVPTCVNPGVPPTGLAVLRFPDDTAPVGAEVSATYNFHGKYKNTVGEAYEVVYHLDMVGTITASQWPPPDGQTLEITLTGWTRLFAGAKEKNACKVTPTLPISFASPVVFTITRDDAAHTDDECDCPFDYQADLVCQ